MASLLTILGLDGAQYYAGLNKAVSKAAQAGKEIKTALGGQIATALSGITGAFAAGELIRSAVEMVGHIKDLSEEFRVDTDTIQRWDVAARRIGLTAEDVGNALNKIKKSRDAALGTGPEAAKMIEAFGSLGISAEMLRNASLETDQIMEIMADHVKDRAITNSEDAASMEVIGRSGAKILSTFQQLKDLGPITLIDKQQIEEFHKTELAFQKTKRDVQIGIVSMLQWFAGSAAFVGRQAGAIYERMFNRNVDAESARYAAWDMTMPGAKGTRTERKENVYTATKVVDLNKDAKEIDAMREQLAEKILQTKLKTLTAEERRAEISRQIAEHEKKAIEYEFGEGDDKLALKEKLKAEELRGELAQSSKEARQSLSPRHINSLQQIGAFAGAPKIEELSISIAKDSNEKLGKIEQHVSKLSKAGAFGASRF